MTIKNESKNKNNKTSTPKEILYEAVQKNPTRNYITVSYTHLTLPTNSRV